MFNKIFKFNEALCEKDYDYLEKALGMTLSYNKIKQSSEYYGTGEPTIEWVKVLKKSESIKFPENISMDDEADIENTVKELCDTTGDYSPSESSNRNILDFVPSFDHSNYGCSVYNWFLDKSGCAMIEYENTKIDYICLWKIDNILKKKDYEYMEKYIELIKSIISGDIHNPDYYAAMYYFFSISCSAIN